MKTKLIYFYYHFLFQSDMISIDIDGPSTMLNSICESIVITQGSVYTNNSPRIPKETPIQKPVSKSIFDSNHLQSSPSSHLRHVVLNQHEEYLLDSSRTPTPPTKKDKIEVIDTWHDRTVIEGSSAAWRSPSRPAFKATKRVQPSTTSQSFASPMEPLTVQMHSASSNETKYRTTEHIEIPAVYNSNEELNNAFQKPIKTTRDVALSPILMEQPKRYQTIATSPIERREKIDRSCQYSPTLHNDFASQYHVENFTSSTQVSSSHIPGYLVTFDGTQTIQDMNLPLDDSGIQSHMQTVSPSLSTTSSGQQATHLGHSSSSTNLVRKLNEHNLNRDSALTVTQYTDDNYYLPSNDTSQTTMNLRPQTLERSADSGILVDDQVCFASYLLIENKMISSYSF